MFVMSCRCQLLVVNGVAVLSADRLLPALPPAAVTPKSCSATGAAAIGNDSYVVLSTLAGAAGVMQSPSGTCQLMLTATDLYIQRNTDNTITYLARDMPPATSPRYLMLTPSGLMMLQDASGLIHWASTGACNSSSNSLAGKCFFAQMQDDCTVAVRDDAGNVVWRYAAGTPSRLNTRMQQLVSSGTTAVSCVQANASYASSLFSDSQRFKLVVSRQGKGELLDLTTSTTVWIAVPAARWHPAHQQQGQHAVEQQLCGTRLQLMPACATQQSSSLRAPCECLTAPAGTSSSHQCLLYPPLHQKVPSSSGSPPELGGPHPAAPPPPHALHHERQRNVLRPARSTLGPLPSALLHHLPSCALHQRHHLAPARHHHQPGERRCCRCPPASPHVRPGRRHHCACPTAASPLPPSRQR